MTAAIRATLGKNKGEFDPRKYLKPAQEAMVKVCKQRYEEFGTAGQAGKIKPVPLSEMAKRYASGALDPRFASKKAAE
jgi:fructose-bisphosphate aldolase class II